MECAGSKFNPDAVTSEVHELDVQRSIHKVNHERSTEGLKGELNGGSIALERVDANIAWRGGMLVPEGWTWKEFHTLRKILTLRRVVYLSFLVWNAERFLVLGVCSRGFSGCEPYPCGSLCMDVNSFHSLGMEDGA